MSEENISLLMILVFARSSSLYSQGGFSHAQYSNVRPDGLSEKPELFATREFRDGRVFLSIIREIRRRNPEECENFCKNGDGQK